MDAQQYFDQTGASGERDPLDDGICRDCDHSPCMCAAPSGNRFDHQAAMKAMRDSVEKLEKLNRQLTDARLETIYAMEKLGKIGKKTTAIIMKAKEEHDALLERIDKALENCA